MRLLSGIILALFLGFLSTPTIVGWIKKNADTSVFFNAAEEEISHKHLKTEALVESSFEFIPISTENKGAIIRPQNLRHDSVAATIVIPPPEQV